jgi:hypothetical protein
MKQNIKFLGKGSGDFISTIIKYSTNHISSSLSNKKTSLDIALVLIINAKHTKLYKVKNIEAPI